MTGNEHSSHVPRLSANRYRNGAPARAPLLNVMKALNAMTYSISASTSKAISPALTLAPMSAIRVIATLHELPSPARCVARFAAEMDCLSGPVLARLERNGIGREQVSAGILKKAMAALGRCTRWPAMHRDRRLEAERTRAIRAVYFEEIRRRAHRSVRP